MRCLLMSLIAPIATALEEKGILSEEQFAAGFEANLDKMAKTLSALEETAEKEFRAACRFRIDEKVGGGWKRLEEIPPDPKLILAILMIRMKEKRELRFWDMALDMEYQPQERLIAQWMLGKDLDKIKLEEKDGEARTTTHE